jgi:hypothetical protein
MAGLVPAIHVFALTRTRKTWMPATSAGMTKACMVGSPNPGLNEVKSGIAFGLSGPTPIDQKLRIFACTFAAPFQSVAPFQRIFSRHEAGQAQNRAL